MILTWKDREGANTDKVAYIGKYIAFEICYNMFSNKNDPKDQNLTCKLNGFKKQLGGFQEVGKAMEYAEKVAEKWLEGSGLVKEEFKEKLGKAVEFGGKV